jgi:predicted nucleic acid-binding protein
VLSDLDRGEAEVIALAQELGADLLIIDERLARRHTRRLGLTLTGTLGVLLRAKSTGLIPSVAPLIEQMLRDGIHLGDSVVAEALRLAGEV